MGRRRKIIRQSDNRNSRKHRAPPGIARSIAPPLIEALEGRWFLSASSLAAGPDGNIWFTNPDNGAIARQTPGASVTEFHLPDPAALPDQITAGPDGNLWFVDSNSGQIGRMTPAGEAVEFAMPSPDSDATVLAAGPDGNLWFIDDGTSAIGSIAPTGSVTEFPVDSTNLWLDNYLVAGPDGNLWTTAEDNSDKSLLVRMTPAGMISRFALPTYSNGLTVGPGKNLWIAGDGEIDRVTTDGSVTRFELDSGDSASSIVAGSDGALWFAVSGSEGASMGRMTRNGDVFEFNPPGATDYDMWIYGLAAGPDGNISYATDSIGDASPIGSFDPHNALLASGERVSAVADALDSVENSLATFADLSGKADASFYQATINWGDGTTSAGDIYDNEDGTFDVFGAHTWPIGGFNISIAITDIRFPAGASADVGGRTLTALATATAQPPPAQGTGVAIDAVSGQLFSGVVAHFAGVAMNSLSVYSSTINWGDGSYSTGIITPDGQGGITVSGSNRYAHSGSFTVTTTLNPYAHGDPSATSTATVSTGVMEGNGKNLQVDRKQPFSGTIAAFTLADPVADLSHFHATINWIIGGSYFAAPAPITEAPIASDGQGGFIVSLNTTFTQSADYRGYQVLIRDDRLGTGDSAIVGAANGQLSGPMGMPWLGVPSSGASIAGAATTAPVFPRAASASRLNGTPHSGSAGGAYHGTPGAISATVGQTFHGPIATLTGPSLGGSQLLKATIHWGNGRRSPGTLVSTGPNEWQVIATHTFAKKGAPQAHVTVRLAARRGAKLAKHAPIITRLTITGTVAGRAKGT